jgi:cytochrome c oxidase subunit 2
LSAVLADPAAAPGGDAARSAEQAGDGLVRRSSSIIAGVDRPPVAFPTAPKSSPRERRCASRPRSRRSMTTPRRSGLSPAILLGGAALVVVVVFLGILALRGNVVDQLGHVWASFFPPAATTAEGAEIRGLYDVVFLFAAVIFLVVEALIVFAVVRYHRRPTDTELPPQIHGNNLLEIVWTLIPTAIVLFLFVISWQTLNNVDRVDAANPIQIRAVASRFQWGFEYLSPDGSKVVFKQFAPELVVPAGQKVHLRLQSPDVIHAFYVPQFLFKRDVVPGKENTFDFTVDPADAGQTFRGQCAELCGEGHWVMQFTVQAKTPADYQAWLQQQVQQAAQQQAQQSGQPGQASPGASGAPAGTTLQLTAQNIAYKEQTLETAANAPFTIAFTNDDNGVPHNVDIQDSSGASKFKGQIFAGTATQNYAVPPLPAGTYKFVCDVHPNMTGTLTVK